MTNTQETLTGWCCTDCLMLIANGEGDPYWSEEEERQHLANMDQRCAGTDVTLGLLASEHEEYCPVASGDTEWCDCEEQEFSWRSCDTCGSHLGGSRHAVTFWLKEESK